MIKCKESTRWRLFRRELLILLLVVEAVFKRHSQECVATCGTDGHGPDDPHYNGYAIDVRSKHLSAEESHAILKELQDEAGLDYYIFLEAEGTDNEHYHAQLRKGLWQERMAKEGMA